MRFLIEDLGAHVGRREPNDLVFAGIRNGAPLRVSTFRLQFGVAAQAIGIPDLHPHQLRHTAASLAIASGGGREGRPADARSRLRDHDAGHLRAPLRGPPLDEVGDALDRARTAARERRQSPDALPRVARAQIWSEMPKRAFPAFPQVRTPSHTRTPDGIRTRATALRGRSRGSQPTLKIDESAGQTGFLRLANVGNNGPFLDLVLPQCCQAPDSSTD